MLLSLPTHLLPWLQVFMLSPLLVAFICKWLFGMPLPQRLWPALALTVTGQVCHLPPCQQETAASQVLLCRVYEAE